MLQLAPGSTVPGSARRLLTLTGLALAAASIALPTPRLSAQGFAVTVQSACAMARGAAVVARPCDDGSAVFFNPAGLVDADGWRASAGTAVIATDGAFVPDDGGARTDLVSDARIVPHAFVHYEIDDGLAAGFGAYAAYGFSTTWPRDFDGAFLSYDSALQSLYLQPTLAYRLTERIAIGGGPILALSSVELNRTVDLSGQAIPGTDFGFDDLGVPEGTPFAATRLHSGWGSDRGVGWGANLGLHARLSDRIEVGVRFLTPVRMRYEGTASFTQIETGLLVPEDNPLDIPEGTPIDALVQSAFEDGPLVEQAGSTELTFPAQLVGGVHVHARPGLILSMDAHWFNWSSFDRVELRFEQPVLDDVLVQNYEDAWAIRVGAGYAVAPAWSLGVGYIRNTSASPPETVTPLVPEADRQHLTLGVEWQASERLAVHGTYHRLFQADRRGRTVGPPPGEPPSVELNSGTYRMRAHLFAITASLGGGR